MSRIELTDNFQSAMLKMCEGNPGALRVLMELAEMAPAVDPQSFMGPLAPMLLLDTLEIYGSDIWVLYKDVCGENTLYVLATLRGNQLGLLPQTTLKNSIKQQRSLFDEDVILEKVMGRLESFNRTETVKDEL